MADPGGATRLGNVRLAPVSLRQYCRRLDLRPDERVDDSLPRRRLRLADLDVADSVRDTIVRLDHLVARVLVRIAEVLGLLARSEAVSALRVHQGLGGEAPQVAAHQVVLLADRRLRALARPHPQRRWVPDPRHVVASRLLKKAVTILHAAFGDLLPNQERVRVAADRRPGERLVQNSRLQVLAQPTVLLRQLPVQRHERVVQREVDGICDHVEDLLLDVWLESEEAAVVRIEERLDCLHEDDKVRVLAEADEGVELLKHQRRAAASLLQHILHGEDVDARVVRSTASGLPLADRHQRGLEGLILREVGVAASFHHLAGEPVDLFALVVGDVILRVEAFSLLFIRTRMLLCYGVVNVDAVRYVLIVVFDARDPLEKDVRRWHVHVNLCLQLVLLLLLHQGLQWREAQRRPRVLALDATHRL